MIFLLAISLQGIILSLALFSRFKYKHRSNPFLGLIVLMASLELLYTWALNTNYIYSKNAFPFWILLSYYFLPVALWFFVKIDKNLEFKAYKYWYLFIPAVIEICVETVSFILYKLQIIHSSITYSKYWFIVTEKISVLPMLFVLFILIKEECKIISKEIRIKSLVKIRINASRLLITFYFLTTLFWVFGVLFNKDIFFSINIFCQSFIFIIGYIAFFKPHFFKSDAKKSKYVSYDDVLELKKLNELILKQRLFENPNLTLKLVSEELALPSRYVSYLVNYYYNKNFKSFINNFRVNEMISKLESKEIKSKTILALALESGFNSKSSFNKVFKELTGKNPTDFIK